MGEVSGLEWDGNSREKGNKIKADWTSTTRCRVSRERRMEAKGFLEIKKKW